VLENAVDYYPYGKVLREFSSTNGKERFLTTHHERDRESGLDYRGARFYDGDLGRFLSLDPLARKFTRLSPYNYVFGNPAIVVDPDGKEGIVVSGQPGNHQNKEHFLVNGLSRAKAAQGRTKSEDETVTWLVYSDGSEDAGHNQQLLDTYQKLAAEAGITMSVVSSVDEIVSYINNKTGGKSRSEDQITSFYYVGHATPGDLDVGYGGSGENFEPDDLNASAFSQGCHVNLIGGCRTAKPGVFEDSAVTQFQEILDITSRIFGSEVRVQYNGGEQTDEQLLRENQGEIIQRNGEIKTNEN